MKKPIIIAIVGESGSGKTTLSFHLADKHNIPFICSYTTRPIREGEVNGRDHWFVDICALTPTSQLAYTNFGGYQYWTLVSQVDKCEVCSYVIDEKGLIDLMSRWSDKYEILPVYINRPNRKDIAVDRKNRDGERVVLNEDQYSIIINNTQDLETFLTQSSTIILSTLKQMQNGN